MMSPARERAVLTWRPRARRSPSSGPATSAARLPRCGWPQRGYADIVLYDVVDGLPQGKALDLLEAGPVKISFGEEISGTTDYAATEGSDVVVFTSGAPRKPGHEPRRPAEREQEDRRGGEHGPDRPLLPRTRSRAMVNKNPLDAMGASGLPGQRLPEGARRRPGRHPRHGALPHLPRARAERVFGARRAGLRAGRTRRRHGAGAGCTDRRRRADREAGLPKERVEAIVERTRKGGAEIVDLLKTGSAFYAPSGPA